MSQARVDGQEDGGAVRFDGGGSARRWAAGQAPDVNQVVAAHERERVTRRNGLEHSGHRDQAARRKA